MDYLKYFVVCVGVVFLSFSSVGWTHNKVVVVPLFGDSAVSAKLKNVIVVAPENGDFTNPLDAVNSIEDASPLNPYVVFVAPGRYSVPSNQQLVMKPFVDVVGSGRERTILNFARTTGGPNNGGAKESKSAALIVGTDQTTIADLSITGENLAGFTVGVHFSDPVPVRSFGMRLKNVSINAFTIPGGGVGVYTTSRVSIEQSIIIAAGDFGESFGVINDGGSVKISQSIITSVAILATNVPAVYGIYNLGNAVTDIVETKINPNGNGAAAYGIFNAAATASAKVRGSTIAIITTTDATATSIVASSGAGSSKTFVSNSFLSNGVTGNPVCNFVFTVAGDPLDSECKMPAIE